MATLPLFESMDALFNNLLQKRFSLINFQTKVLKCSTRINCNFTREPKLIAKRLQNVLHTCIVSLQVISIDHQVDVVNKN